MGEDFERAYRHAAPRVSFDGWWWKKYIPYFQRMRRVCQAILDQNWEMRREEVDEVVRHEEKRERDTFIRSMSRDIYP